MAYDKVIDSAKLEAAITATADAIRAKTGSAEKIPWDESQGMAGAVRDIATGVQPTGTLEIIENGTFDVTEYASAEVAVPMVSNPSAESVKFGNEQIDPDVMYAVGYNWFAEVVRKLQPMVGTTQDMTPSDILDFLDVAIYIPQGRASSMVTLDTSLFESGAVGILPNVQRGTAASILTFNTSLFTSSAVGALVEG